MESPDVPRALELAVRSYELPVRLDDVTYFLRRETLLATSYGEMGPREEAPFGFLTRNSRNARRYFGIPPERVVEIRMELPELDPQNPDHRAFIFGLSGVLPEHAAELGLANIYTAQTVWDETMADTSARWFGEGVNRSLVIFSGLAQCHRTAIPARISRRTERVVLALRAVFESELTRAGFSPDGYDLLVVLRD